MDQAVSCRGEWLLDLSIAVNIIIVSIFYLSALFDIFEGKYPHYYCHTLGGYKIMK